MTCSERVSQWTATVSRHLPHLSRPQASVLALWSLGMVLARSCGLSQVSVLLALLLGQSEETLRQRLREWYYPAPDKTGKQRRTLEVATCFAPLLRWVLAWWPEEHQELALALDATTLGQRFTVLCVSVLVRGCAIPVAWKVLAYNQKGSWQPYWQTLLAHLDGVIPAEWTVLVLADRGLYARLSVSPDCGPRLASVPAHQSESESLCAGQRQVGMDQPLAARLRTAVGSTGGLFCRQEDPPGLHLAAVPRAGL